MDRKELTRDEVYKLVKNRKAQLVFQNAKVNLTTLSLDGTNVHTKGIVKCFDNYLEEYENGNFPKEETMRELRSRNSVVFNDSIRYLEASVNKYKINL
jgi:DNA topoisomerase IA